MDTNKKCGIIMPISADNDYSSQHWENVKKIIYEAIESTEEFTPMPVWVNDKTDIIHKTIVQNLLDCEMAVCDISNTNPNVMYELGLRMTAKKPVIIIKDDKTKEPFDVNLIRFEKYPMDLNYYTIRVFIENLKSRIESTWEEYTKNPDVFQQIIGLDKTPMIKLNDSNIDVTCNLQEAINFIFKRCVSEKEPLGNDTLANLFEINWQLKSSHTKLDRVFKKVVKALEEFIYNAEDKKIKDDLDNLKAEYNVFCKDFKNLQEIVEGMR